MSFMLDTDMETQKKYYANLKRMTPEKRLAQGLRLSKMVREMCLESIRRKYPEYGSDEIRREYLKRILSPEEFKVFYKEAL